MKTGGEREEGGKGTKMGRVKREKEATEERTGGGRQGNRERWRRVGKRREVRERERKRRQGEEMRK